MKIKENEEYSLSVPVGRNNAVSRKWLVSHSGLSDRQVRDAISRSGDPIINLGYGYFIPDPNDPEDMHELHTYIVQEQARILSLQEKMNHKFATHLQDHQLQTLDPVLEDLEPAI